LTSPWLLPPAWFLPFNALLVLLDRRVPIVQLLQPPASYVGWLPILVGVAICAVGAVQFRRHRTTIRPFHESERLITSGLFSFSRNPIYVGMVLAMLGVALNAGSLSAMFVPPLFAAALWVGFIRREERALADRFGGAYEDYRRRVRRWI
jgi:protein-S-isoprenylcysteine O-methyltransferase Ste14